MKMFPSYLYDTQSNAEKKVFQKIQSTTTLGKDAVAFHSLNIPEHINQRSGEADFVILCKTGLFVLEVKGGKIWRNANGWTFTDRNGKNYLRKKGPFRQAEDAMYSIIDRIKNKFGDKITKTLIFGYGVILPDCNLPESEEWSSNILLNSNNFNLFDRWLSSFAAHWREQTPWGKALSDDALKEIASYLRPDFETAIALHSQIENAEEQIERFTNEQFNFLDIMKENNRIICSGGAGTGKTFLAAELSRRLSPENTVLFVCRSKILSSYLKSKLRDIKNTVVSSFDALSAESSRRDIEKFDVLILDEGQDLCNFEDLTVLESYLKKGWRNGTWYFFHDINNQAGIVGKYDPDAMEYLKSFPHVSIPLRKNCRNTKPIVEEIQRLTNSDMGVPGNGIGPEVEVINASEGGQAEELCRQLEKLRAENISFHDITILSAKDFNSSCVNKLQRSSRKHIQVINDFNISSPDLNKIQFSRIGDFKGLESQCVIIIDVDKNLPNYQQLLYIGMSRARAKLILILNT